MINPAEVDELLFTDDVDEAFAYIIRALETGATEEDRMEGNLLSADGEALSTMTS